MKTGIFIFLTAILFNCSAPQEKTTEAAAIATASTDQEAPTAHSTIEAPPQAAAVAINQSLAQPVVSVEESTPAKAVKAETTEVELKPVNTERKKTSGLVLTETEASKAPPTPTHPVIKEDEPAAAAPKSMPDHTIWDKLLRNFVSSTGQVNYSGLKGSTSTLNSYLTELESFPPQDGWSRNQIMAYWINAYNAYTIKLIIDNYPVSSIMNLHGGKTWDRKWIKIGGNTYSLNQIENDILRARYGDARIHFAVNCAAASCPPLHNRAFTTDNLNSTLQRLTRRFVNNTAYNTITSEKIEISKIFEWYRSDFGNVTSYINGFTDVELGPDTQVSYKEYDWALNGK